MKIYLIEDEQMIREELAKLLQSYGYECEYATEFETIGEDVKQIEADLILLDINLPYCDGYYLCREIRKVSEVPIIVVTSRNSDMDELMSMNLGADDFITKPYNKQILLARIAAILKRSMAKEQSDKVMYKDLEFYPGKGMIKYQEQQVELTKNELKILSIFMENKGRIVGRDEIMNELWQAEEFVDENTLTVNVNRLRKKIEEIGLTDYIVTKRGQGYLV